MFKQTKTKKKKKQKKKLRRTTRKVKHQIFSTKKTLHQFIIYDSKITKSFTKLDYGISLSFCTFFQFEIKNIDIEKIIK